MHLPHPRPRLWEHAIAARLHFWVDLVELDPCAGMTKIAVRALSEADERSVEPQPARRLRDVHFKNEGTSKSSSSSRSRSDSYSSSDTSPSGLRPSGSS